MCISTLLAEVIANEIDDLFGTEVQVGRPHTGHLGKFIKLKWIVEIVSGCTLHL